MKTLNELRQALLDTVEDVRKQKITSEQALAISKNAQAIINLTRLELDFAILVQNPKKVDIKFLNRENEETEL